MGDSSKLVPGRPPSAPQLLQKPFNSQLIEGSDLTFQVQVTGNPLPSIKWSKDGRPVGPSERISMSYKDNMATLVVRNVTPTDAGVYTLVAENENGRMTCSCDLVIQKSTIYSHQQQQQVQYHQLQQQQQQQQYLLQQQQQFRLQQQQQQLQQQQQQQIQRQPIYSNIQQQQAIVRTESESSVVSQYGSVASQGSTWYPNNQALKTSLNRNKVTEQTTVQSNESIYNRQISEQQRRAGQFNVSKTSQVISETEQDPSSETVYLRHIERPKPSLKRQDSDERYQSSRPAFTANLRNLTVAESERAVFDARLIPIGDPNLKIEWYHNENPLEASSRVMTTCNFGYVTLTLLHISAADAGIYTCRAYNDLGEATTQATLNVRAKPIIERTTQHPESLEAIRHLEDHERYQRHQSIDETLQQSTSPPTFIKPLSNLENLIESGYAHFEAQLSPVNDPTMKVEWYFNGKPLALGSRISTIFSFGYVALNISYLRVEDSGVYLCRAINSKGEAISQATLRVKSTGAVTTRTDLEEQQEFIKKTQELEAYRNAYHSQISEEQLPQESPCFKHQLKDQVNVIERRTAHFEATLEPTGDPSMRVEWLKDGQPLEASSRINSFFNFGYVALTIEKIELRDAGQYTCIATNSRGSASTSARLSVISKKSIITDVQYEEGWEKIQHLEDHSRYSGTREEEIEIKERPRFTAPLSGPDALVEGKSAHFETRLEPMSDPSMKVEWYFNGRPLTTGHRFKTYFDFGYVALDILYVFPEDNGLFTVKAVNKLGEAILNKQLTIQSRSSVDTSTIHDVSMKQIKYLERSHEEPSYQIDDYSKVKPYFVQQLRNPGREFAEGEKAHLEARIEPVNDPSLSVAWFCNGRPLKTGSRFITRFDFGYISLDITDLFAEDSGEYTVRVTNTLGSAHSSASILVNRGSRVVTASQYPDSVEQIRHLEDHSRYKREEQVESSIDKAPVFTKPLKNVETVEGTNVHLETRLLPSGDNSMKVEWFKNGVALAIGHRFRPRYDFDFVSLDLLGVYAEDSGVYTCKAKNALGEAVTSCNIQIWAKDPSVIQEPQHPEAYQQIQHLEDHSRYKRSTSQEEIVACRPRFLTRCKDVHVREGAMAHFECRIEPVNDPKVKVEWFHNGVQMMVGSRFQPFHDFGYVALNILKCIEEDSGVYTCRITNDLGSADMPVNLTVTSQASIELSSNNPEAFKKIRQLEDYSRYHREQVDEEVIRSGPVFTTAPRSLEISEGERARFECSLSPVGDPNLKVEWYKDGLPVKQGSRFVQIFDFGFVALEIMGAYPEDSGQYTCKAKNAFGEAITSAQLKCHGKKSLITEPQVPESLEAIQALEGHGRRVRAEIEEPVTTQAPVFTSAMKNIELQENGTAHFECRVIPVGDPTLRVEWFQNGMPLLQGSRVRTQHDFGYVALDLSRVLPEDSGTYTCKAINALGQAMTSATLKVTATGSILMDSQFPEGLQKITQLESQQKYVREQVDERPTDSRPVFITALKGPTDLVEGQSGHYECRIEPFPDPTMKVEWFRNGQSLTLGHRFRTMFDFGFAALDILQIIPEDSGEYTIRATNHLGTATSSISIRVHGKESIIMEPQQPDSIAKIRALEGQSRYYREEVREVEIREKPNFGRPLYNLDNLREGQTAHLEATLTPVNDPSMRVEWFVNGIPIPTGSRFKTMHDFGYVALDVADVVPEDSGIYMCKATNKNGEAVVTCSVRVSGGSAIETGTLHEESLAQIQRLESHYTRPVEAPLPAQQRPVFTKPLQSLEGLKEGQSAHLECRLEPINDPKLRVEWFVNGQSIKTGHRFRTTHDFGYVALDILYTFPEDSGTYICRATNELGEAVTTANVSVTAKKSIYSDTYHPEGLEKIAVLESQGLPQRAEIEDRPISKPVFVSELRGRTDYVEGSSAHFEGRIEPAHDPNLKVEIYHNGKLLGAGSRFHRTFDFGYVALDIMSLVPEDSGTYTVRAFNQLDEARSSITINIKGQSSILLDTLHSSALPKIQYLENPVVAEKIQEIPTFQRPVFTQPLVNLENLAEGGSAHLECRLIPVGDANLKVEWFHNSVPLQTGSRFKTVHDFGYVALDIMYLTAEDAGIYMCKATNQLGEAITSCSLKIKTKATIELESQHPEGLQKIRQLEESNRKVEAYIPEKVYDRPMFISPLVGPNEISEGSPAHFECRVIPSDDPNLTVHWFINGVELKAGSRFAVVNNFGFVSLDIAYAYPEDSGVYMCKAINKAGEAVTSTSLHVKGKSSILSETLHPGAVQKTALLESSANRIPAAIESKPVKAPVFTRHLTSHEMLVEGQNVHIGGAIEPVDDEKLIIKWYKNGQQLTEASRIITRFDFGLVSLDIIGVRPDDSGIYTCRAVNEVGEAVSTCTIKVEGREGLILGTEHPESLQKIRELESYQAVKNEVAEPEFSAPVFITHLNNVELKEGERAHFECRVEPSKDNSLRIEFFKNNKPLQTGSRFSVKNDFGFITLDISACQAEDSGIYTCKATNSKGQAISTGSLKVISKSSIILTPQHPMGPEALEKIQQLEARSGYIAPVTSEVTYPKPYFVTPLAANFTVQEGRPLHLECRVEPSADPNLTIEWFINGKQLEMGNRFNLVNDFGFVVFDIKDTWDRDSGIYTCKARNAQGEAFTSTTILVVSSETSVIQTTLHPEGQRGLEEIQRLEESLRRKEAILAPEEGRAPVFTSQFKPLSNLTEGEAAHFEATLEPVGDQTMKVEWYHNGKAIKIGHRIRTYYAFGLVLLEIIDLRHEDAGEYICIAINKWGRAEASMTLEIVDRDKGEKPKFTTQLTSQSGLKEGESVHLECNLIPVGDPNLFVKWYHNRVELRESSRIKTLSDFGFVVLDISFAHEEDSGEYVCVATNKYGSDVTRCTLEITGSGGILRDSLQPQSLQAIAELEGMSSKKSKSQITVDATPSAPPKFITQITSLPNLVEGQSAHFEAQLSPANDPYLKVEWFINGRPLPSGHRFRTFYDFGIVILDILDLVAEDSGEYVCKATNKLGTDITRATLIIKARSSVIYDPQLPPEMTSNERILQIEEMRTRRRIDITEEIITEAPRFIKPLENPPKLREGENAHLVAELTPTNDPNLTVSWFKNGISLQASTRIRTIHDFGFVILEISPVYPSDSGVYTCKAVNKYGEAVTTCTIEIQGKRSIILESQLPQGMEGGIEKIAAIEEAASSKISETFLETSPKQAPKFLTQPNDQELPEDAMAHFDCRLIPVTDPTMKVEWFFNGRSLVTGSRVKTISDFGYVILEIAGVYARDSGIYTCKATNAYGEASVSCKLTVKSKQSIILEPQLPQQFITGTESIQKLEESLWRTPEMIYDKEKSMPPKFVTHIRDMEKSEGESAHFECRLEPVGDPYLKIEWYVNGVLLLTGSRIRTVNDFGFIVLEIDWLLPRDTGEYLCKATNKHGTDITRAVLKVKSKRDIIIDPQLPPEFSVDKLKQLDMRARSEAIEEDAKIQAPRFITQIHSLENLMEGDSAHFECKLLPVDDPNLRVEWYHNGKPLISGHRFKTTHDFGFVALDILYVHPEDSGEYIARAVNLIGEDITRAIIRCRARQKIIYNPQLPKEMESGIQKIAQIESSRQRYETTSAPDGTERCPPMFVMKPEPLTVLEGEWAKFCCRVVGYPRPRVMWVLNGNTVINGSRYRLSYDGIYHLDIPRPRQYDGGKIEVYARNILGEAHCWTTLDVRPRNSDYRAVLKHSPRPWYDYDITRYQKERIETELDKVFEEKLTPGGTESEVWRTEETDDERIKVKEYQKNQEAKPEIKKYSTEAVYANKQAIQEAKPQNQSNVSWMAKSYQSHVQAQSHEPITPESMVHGKEIFTKQQKQIQKEIQGDLEITRKIRTTETVEQEHKGVTKERRVIGPPRKTRPPEFTKKIQPVRVYEGDRATFECTFVGEPIPTLTWYRENFEIQNSRDFQIETTENKSSLTIREVYLEDSGVFSVKAENTVGSAKSSANLVVEERKDHKSGAVPPSFTKTIEDTRAKTGELVRFDARVIGTKPLDVYWLKNGNKIIPGLTHKMIDDEDQNTLLILEAVPEDTGTYECVAINQVGEARCQAKLRIEGTKTPSVPSTPTTPASGKEKPPMLTEPLKDLVVNEGESATFKCKINGVTASQVAWYKGDSLIKQSRYFRMGHERDAFTLKISEAFPEDDGTYKCIASNSLGSVTTSAKLKVIVPESLASAPNLSPLQDLTIPVGTPARFVTSLSGWPTPNISWFKDGQLIQPSRDFQMFQDNASCSLVIRQVYPEDSGIYICRATNESGQAETSARLIVDQSRK